MYSMFFYKKFLFTCTALFLSVCVLACGCMTGTKTDSSSGTMSTSLISTSQSSILSSTQTAASQSSSTVTQVVYNNPQYGFMINLPASWSGYKVLTDVWLGYNVQKGDINTAGIEISIRHPLWTQKVPRQDIPIYIFTTDQWNSLQKEVFHIGAAPVGPTKLASNSKYVFALPARYNYAFPKGYEEVDSLMNSNALTAFEPQV